MITPVWFATTYMIMAGLRPEYSHYTKAISELGSVGAPRAWVWNVFGYIIPGVVVALLGVGVRNRFGNARRAAVSSGALVMSGLLMALSGLFPGDFENRTSTTMVFHAVGSFGSFLAFLVCAFSIPGFMRRIHAWRPFVWPSLALATGSIVTGFLRTGRTPGVGQRLGFICFFLWVALIGYALFTSPTGAEDAAA